jgi:PST family polysaccharide transporter
VLTPLVVAAVAAGAAALVARELDSPLLSTLAAGVICLAAIACILALHPEQVRQIRALRSGAVALEGVAAQDPVDGMVP